MSAKRWFVLSALSLVAVWPVAAQGYIIPLPPPPRPPWPPGPVTLEVKSHRVEVTIENQVAKVAVDQVFRNQYRHRVEGTYYFPLPADAAISDFALFIDGKRVEGELLDRDKARRIYEDIVRRMKDPALLEYVGRNLFRARVFPIPAGGTRRIQLEYSQHVPFDAGTARFVYPLKCDKPSFGSIGEFAISVAIDSAQPLKSVYSPTHEVDVARRGDRHAVVSAEATNYRPDQDFTLYFTTSKQEFGLHLIANRKRGEDGFFLLMLAPRQEFAAEEIIAKDVVFVFDTSGSMAGEKIRQAQAALRYCLDNLNRKDRFGLITFSTEVRAFEDELVEATKQRIDAAQDFVGGVKARGGTDINAALLAALKMFRGDDRPGMLVFLTDGRPTMGVTKIEGIIENVDRANRRTKQASGPPPLTPWAVLAGAVLGARSPLEQRISVHLRQVRDIAEVLSLIARAASIDVVVQGDVRGTVGKLELKNQTIEQVLKALAERVPFEWEVQKESIIVRPVGAKVRREPEPRRVAIRPADERRPRRARIFVFGVGHNVNTHLLDKIASRNGGASTYVGPKEDIELAVTAFYAKVSYPVLSNLHLDWGDIKTYDVFPRELPDLFRGSQLTVLGRYTGSGTATVVLSGEAAQRQQAFEYETRLPEREAKNGFIPRLWAQRKIGYLLDEIRLHGEDPELKQAIVDLSLEYGIVTPYTSYLVQQDERIVRRLPRPVQLGRVFEQDAAALAPGMPGGMAVPSPERADLRRQVGAGAVRAAKAAKELRRGEVVQKGGALRYVAGHTFFLDGEVWRDVKFDQRLPVTEIKVNSQAYFDLLAARPDWGPILALGPRVVLRIGERILQIGETGAETLSAEEITSLTRE